ncbi:hypothetical protein LCL99_11235 [Halomonas denitrificans]|uniref:hypothetical protein n=1 Tax=Halomonas TaxID=2745 RepID=UPI001CD5343D|nr:MULTISPECIES: hypothetical protein [Halomonas]MCA0914812.1 hypothetical protein [Halomonas denitrificans]MCA0975045.1 hypothetical protein [Halomonas denitrificans]MED5294706.1 hypothetical protein [Pseudomonadota bacterium]
MKRTSTLLSVAVASAMMLSGCASIVGDRDQAITINSAPTHADITIVDEKGQQVFEGSTPTSVTLKKADGSYFGGKDYVVTISKDGFQSRSIEITSHANGWYVGGNLIFGGLIGWLIVDPLTGAMYSLTPDEINTYLGDSLTSTQGGEQEVTLVLIEDVPQELRNNLKLLSQR